MSVQYSYDMKGRRSQKTVNGVLTAGYVYNGNNLIEERDGSGNVTASYVYAGGVDHPVAVNTGGATYYFQQDALGNVTALTNSTGVLVEQYSYDVYGQPTIKDGSGNPKATAMTPYLFTGREYDSEVQLYHYRSRAYSTILGRFLQPDSIKFNGKDTNIYRYVRNNPINASDPKGFADAPQGHHLVPQSLWKKAKPCVKAVFDSVKNRITDPNYRSHNGKLYNGVSESKYRSAVQDRLNNFLNSMGESDVSELTAGEAQEFADEIANTSWGEIGAYNAGVAGEMAGDVGAITASTVEVEGGVAATDAEGEIVGEGILEMFIEGMNFINDLLP